LLAVARVEVVGRGLAGLRGAGALAGVAFTVVSTGVLLVAAALRGVAGLALAGGGGVADASAAGRLDSVSVGFLGGVAMGSSLFVELA
jgi:hypothetical protein